MANPTTNFGWQMPTSTDLVTDLPADFEVFGQAVDTDFVDLLGGANGYILSKASATDLDFAWIPNDQGDITAVNVTAPITGGGSAGAVTIGVNAASTAAAGVVQLSDSTSTTSSVLASTPTATKSAYDLANTANTAAGAAQTTANAAIPKSTVTTAGDVIYATGSSALTRLGIGTAGQVLKVNSGATAPEWATASSGTFPILTTTQPTGDFSTASTTFVDITNVSITRTPVSATNKFEIKFSFVCPVSTGLQLDLKCFAGATSLLQYTYEVEYNGASPDTINAIWYATNVPASSTVFKVQAKVSTGTVTFYGTTTGYANGFSVLEIY